MSERPLVWQRRLDGNSRDVLEDPQYVPLKGAPDIHEIVLIHNRSEYSLVSECRQQVRGVGSRERLVCQLLTVPTAVLCCCTSPPCITKALILERERAFDLRLYRWS